MNALDVALKTPWDYHGSSDQKTKTDPPDCDSSSVSTAIAIYNEQEFLPLPTKGKKPWDYEKGIHIKWKDGYQFDPSLFENADCNIGIVLGDRSNGLTDIDLDCPEAIAIAPLFLPSTDWKFGRASARESHWVYQLEEGMKTLQFVDPAITQDNQENGEHGEQTEKAMMVEFRCNGAYTIFPPSTHGETGEEIRFSDPDWNQKKPEKVDAHHLLQQVMRLSVAVLLVRHWPATGIRNKTTMALAGALLHSGWVQEEVESFIRVVATQAGDDEVENRVGVVTPAVDRLAAGESVKGIPSLMELLDEKVVEKVVDWLGLRDGVERGDDDSSMKSEEEITTTRKNQPDHDDLIEEMNQDMAVVMVNGECLLLQEQYTHSLDRDQLIFTTDNKLKKWYLNKLEYDGDNQRGEPVFSNPVDLFMRHPNRREYSGIDFCPGVDISPKLNLWRGFGVEPDPNADCSLILDHIKNVICRGNREWYDYYVAWMAHTVQACLPEFEGDRERPGVAIVIKGLKGCGKGMAIRPFGELFGDSFMQIAKEEQLTKSFNDHLKNKVLLYLDEAIWGGNKRSESVLKNVITEPTITVEPKFMSAFDIKNHLRIMMSSNEEWVVPASADSRRFFVLMASDHRINDFDYFAKLNDQINNGGKAGLLHHLIHHDFSGVNLRKAPKTPWLTEQAIRSSTWLMFWEHVLMNGDFSENCDGTALTQLQRSQWLTGCITINKSMVTNAYKSFCKDQGFKPLPPRSMGAELRSCFGKDGEHLKDDRSNKRYTFPDLKTSREHFENFLGHPVPWSESAEEAPETLSVPVL